jgi:hypothetical protein
MYKPLIASPNSYEESFIEVASCITAERTQGRYRSLAGCKTRHMKGEMAANICSCSELDNHHHHIPSRI